MSFVLLIQGLKILSLTNQKITNESKGIYNAYKPF